MRNNRNLIRKHALTLVGTIAMSIPAVVLPADIRGIEYQAEQFLLVERSRSFLQRFPLPMVCADNHQNTVAGRADQFEIGQRENWRRIDENEFEHFIAMRQEFLPARAGAKFRGTPRHIPRTHTNN